MKKRELLEKIENLEDAVIELSECDEKIKNLEKTVEFLCKYDKSEVAVYSLYNNFFIEAFFVEFIYDGELKSVKVPSSTYPKVIENSKERIIIKGDKNYFKVTKSNGEIFCITEFYTEKEQEEKGE